MLRYVAWCCFEHLALTYIERIEGQDTLKTVISAFKTKTLEMLCAASGENLIDSQHQHQTLSLQKISARTTTSPTYPFKTPTPPQTCAHPFSTITCISLTKHLSPDSHLTSPFPSPSPFSPLCHPSTLLLTILRLNHSVVVHLLTLFHHTPLDASARLGQASLSLSLFLLEVGCTAL